MQYCNLCIRSRSLNTFAYILSHKSSAIWYIYQVNFYFVNEVLILYVLNSYN